MVIQLYIESKKFSCHWWRVLQDYVSIFLLVSFSKSFIFKLLNDSYLIMISTICVIRNRSDKNALYSISKCSAYYCTSHFPKSTRKIIKKRKSDQDEKTNDISKSIPNEVPSPPPKIIENQPKNIQDEIQFNSETRTNEINVQMLSKNIYHQLFGDTQHKSIVPKETIQKLIFFISFHIFFKNIVSYIRYYRCKQAHRHHGLKTDDCTFLPEVKLQLPKLEGGDILQHFFNIGEKLSKPYRILTEKIVKEALPPMPKVKYFII